MKKEIADFALKQIQEHNPQYAEVRLETAEGSGYLLKNGQPQISSFDKSEGLSIRYLYKNSLHFLSTNQLTKDKIQELINKSIKTAKSSLALKEYTELCSEPIHKKTYEVKEKIKLADIDPKEKLKLLQDADKAILEVNAKAPGRYLSLDNRKFTEYFTNTEGSQITATIPRVSFNYFITIIENNKTAQRYWQYGNSGGFEFVKQWKIPELLKQEAKAVQNNLKNGVKPPTGKLDIIAAPQVVAIMVHESVGHPYEADRIIGREAAQAGESFVTPGMLNTTIGSEVVNVADDPTIENAYSYYQYDNEGVKARQKLLIKEGKINEFLHNRETAAALNTHSNGSSRAVSFNREPIVRMSNTIMLPGSYKTEEELLEGVKKGIYMKNFMEWNIDDKRLNQKYVGAEAFLIENGKITKPVVQPKIEISTPDLYAAVDAVAQNMEYHSGNCGKGEPMQGLPVWFGGPSIRLRGLRVR